MTPVEQQRSDVAPPAGTSIRLRPGRRRARWAALGLGLLAGLVAVELGLRLFAGSLSLSAFAGWENNRKDGIYRASPTRGYEPIPGKGGYNEHGVLDYGYVLPRRDGLVRILVLGDSVAHRRLWVEGVEHRLENWIGPGRFVEIWNAGVEGYNTQQEEVYLREQGVHLQSDLVLVQFHLNDFLPLPVLFQDHLGQSAYLPFEGEYGRVNRPLFRFSFLYRYFLLRFRPTRADARAASRRGIEQSITNIRKLCEAHKLELFFTIFPLFKARNEYVAMEREWHRWILEILKSQRIRYLDLHDVYPKDQAIERYRQEPEDTWHPNRDGHRVAAAAIAQALWVHPAIWRVRHQEPFSGLQTGGSNP